MKILIVSQYYWPENFLINDLSVFLSEKDLDVTVLTGKPNYPSGAVFGGYRAWGLQRELRNGVTILRVPIYARGQQSRIKLALNYISFVLSASLMGIWALRKQQFDLIFVYAPSPLLQALPAALLAYLRRIPLVVWVQDLWPESLSATGHVKNGLILKGVSTLVKLIYQSCDMVLVQSKAFVDRVAFYTDRRKIRYYPNLYAAEKGQQPSEKAQVLAAEIAGCFSAVFAGNLGTAQSLETIIGAAKILQTRQEIMFYIIGSGSRGEWLEQEVLKLGLKNIRICGRFEASDMPTLLDAASCLLVTLAAEDIFALTVPSKLQAYLSAGRPVVAALNGEGARILEEAQAGIAVSAQDEKALAVSIATIADLPADERTAMGLRGSLYFRQNFSAPTLTTTLISHFRELVYRKEAK